MINCKEKITKNAAVQSNHMHYNTMKQVGYECLYVCIVISSRKKLVNGIKGIFNKVASQQSLKGMYVITEFEYILW